jgi:hypothetical protein
VSLPGRLVGLVLFVLGIAAIVAGGLQILAPQTFDHILNQVIYAGYREFVALP